MTTWVDKSFTLVGMGGYLDKLADIYSAPTPTPQTLTKSTGEKVRAALKQQDDYKLIKTLLGLKRFPFNDPYVSFLRKDTAEIYRNPKTVKRICNRLREMGLDNVIKGLEEPKQFNRQMGAMFSNWLKSKYRFTGDTSAFQKSKESPILLQANGEELRQFANSALGCGLQKQPDFIVKTKGRYVVGEAKFIGTEGGNQNRGFEDALNLASRLKTQSRNKASPKIR